MHVFCNLIEHQCRFCQSTYSTSSLEFLGAEILIFYSIQKIERTNGSGVIG